MTNESSGKIDNPIDLEAIKATKRPLDPSLLAWARTEFSDEEIAAGLREIRETGGLELKDFLHELQQEARPR